jgi:antitoxin PrlF
MTQAKEPPSENRSCCCRIESLVSVDERGQMVLPKEVRERAGLRAGDKLALITWDQGDQVRGILLIKAQDLAGMVRDLLGPLMKDITGES